MKRLSIIFIAVATLAFSSCAMLGGSSDSAAQSLGQTCGTAVLGLYNAYKSTGKIDLTNATNLTNAIALATCYTQIKQNKNNSSYRTAFANGLILSSAGLITNQNSSAFINALINANGLGSGTSSSGVSQNPTIIEPAIVGVLQPLK